MDERDEQRKINAERFLEERKPSDVIAWGYGEGQHIPEALKGVVRSLTGKDVCWMMWEYSSDSANAKHE